MPDYAETGSKEFLWRGFQKLDILTVPCLYIYALMLFAVNNLNIHQNNIPVHGMKTRQQNKLQITLIRLVSIQRDVCYSSVKIFNQLPQNTVKFHNNTHIFKALLRDYLIKNASHSIEEFLSAGHNNADIRTFIFHTFYYVVMQMFALNCCVFMIFSLYR